MFTPLKTLDHAIKYNKYVKPYYYKVMTKFTVFASIGRMHFYKVHIFIFFMQIFPRIILVTFLLIDTFYFCKLEIFYKILLIGILPFILRYCKYSLKDVLEHWILLLENKYKSVRVYEEGYEFDNDRKNNTSAIYYHETKTIREYIEIKFENILTYYAETIDYEYNATPNPQKEFLKQYVLEKYNSTNLRKYTGKDLDIMSSLYKELIPSIMELKLLLYRLEIINETKTIHWFKIIIFSLYLTCWAYILVISYLHKPIELFLGKYFLLNLMTYLYTIDNPFAELFWGSLNENLITIKNLKYMFEKIMEKFKNLIK